MELPEIFQRLGTALGLGLIVGLQRERSGAVLAGIRTFPLITILGALCGWAGSWVIGAGFIALGAVIASGAIQQPDEKNPGLTTEMAMLVMFAVGVSLAIGPIAPPIAVGGAVALLLHLKPQMHGFVAKLGDQDFKAIMQFVVVTLIVLPVLPNRTFGPYDVLNPQRLWLTVVLIVGISLAGFLIYRFYGEKAGTLAAGFLGGLISSTATTVSYARRAKTAPESSRLAAIVIMVASTIVFGRVLFVIGLVAPVFFPRAFPPLLAVFVLGALISGILWRREGNDSEAMPSQGNPTQLRAALFFVVIYAAVLIAVAFARNRLGAGGLFFVAILSGLTDMDAITLSVSQMVQSRQLGASEGWRMILAAALSNLFFKAGIVGFLGNRELLKHISVCFGLIFVAGVGILFALP